MDSHRSTSTLDPRTLDSRTLDHRTPHVPRPPQAREQHALGLSLAQVTGSALAAVSGAVLAAWLGVTGTLVGAAVGSVIGTVGSATYTYSLQRGRDVVVAGRSGVKPTGSATVGAAPAPRTPVEPRATWREWPWKRLTAAAAAALALGIGTLTVLELVAGEPVSSITGGDDSGRTTIGGVISGGRSGGSPDQQDPTPVTPSEPTTPQPSDQSQPSEEPTEVPSEEPAPTPTPTPTPSADPATPVSPGPGTGEGATE